ncbi:MAG: tetratricopeptide repeat protein [Bacteroidia bacterium]
MKEKADIYEWIESYLAGDLEGEALSEFEDRLQTDTEFARQVQLHQELADTFGDPDRDKLLGILSELGDEFSSKQSSPVRSLWTPKRWMTIAAGVLVLCIIGILVNRWSSGKDPQALFDQYYETYSIPGNLRSPETHFDSLWNEGIKAYNEQKYEEAIPLFQQILESDSLTSSASFFLGLSLLEENQLAKSAQALEMTINDENSLFRDQASWYRALIYLKQNQTDNAGETLHGLASKSGKYGELAKELLKVIN